MAVSKAMMSSASAEWMTPLSLYDRLDAIWHFTLDPCTTADNPLGTPKFYTKEDDGLSKDWSGERVFMNPPYGRGKDGIAPWLKAASMWAGFSGTVAVCLIPARTDTHWWQWYVTEAKIIRFLEGRIKFSGHTNSAPFPSAIVVFGELTAENWND